MAKKVKKSNSRDRALKFKVGDLVIAKLGGYPSWPARIESINKQGKYVVRFFFSNDTSPSCSSIKPFSECTQQERNKKNKGLKEAFQLCDEEFAKISGTSVGNHSLTDGDNDDDYDDQRSSSNELEIDTQEALDTTKKITRKEEPNAKDEIDTHKDDIDIKEDIDMKEDIDKQKSESSTPPPPKLGTTPVLTATAAPATIDCSLNDLTSEKANTDHGDSNTDNKSSEILEKLIENEEIKIANLTERLKKKLKMKLAEKEALKKARTDQKRYEKVFKILPKFRDLFESLDKSVKKYSANPKNVNCVKNFTICTKKCENGLGLLTKCIEIMANYQGERLNEYIQFHALLHHTVILMKQVQPKTITSRSFRKSVKKNKTIKDFINVKPKGIKSEPSKRVMIVEAKENPRKRLKISR